MVGRRETESRKSIDKAVLGTVSELPGHNESEPRGGLDKNIPKAEPSIVGRRLHVRSQLTDAILHFGGVVGVAR